VDALLPTLVSRFYLIKSKNNLADEMKMAEKFIILPLSGRIDFIKELLTLPEETEETTASDSARSQALKFLNALELVLHQKLNAKISTTVDFFEHLFKVREFLRQNGSSVKSLMESVALTIPKL
jgi:hypothetical protein